MPGTASDLDSSKHGSLGGALDDASDDYEPSPLPAGLLTPKPGPVPPQVRQKPLAALSVYNTICLRGPCKLLMESTSEIEVEAADYSAVATDRYCLAVPGVLMEVKEQTFTCSHWDPPAPKPDIMTKARDHRRASFLKSDLGVECQKADVEREQKRAEQRAQIDAEAAERQRERDIAMVKKNEAVEAGDFDPQD